jgi:hypothetical protein
LAQELIDGQGGQLVQRAIELAMQGDAAILKALLDRLVPPRKDCPVSLKLPKIEKVEDAAAAMAGIASAITRGTLTPLEGESLSKVFETYRRLIETQELERRITMLEQRKDERTMK